MSLEYDQEMTRKIAEQVEKDARDFVVGAKVYAAENGSLLEGTVTHVRRCFDEEDGPDERGNLPFYTAAFVLSAHTTRYLHQTDAHRFYVDRQDALVDLCENLEAETSRDAYARLELQRQIDRRAKRIEALKAEIAAGPAPVALRY
jgi:hypothetical protein